jgi:Caspase domain
MSGRLPDRARSRIVLVGTSAYRDSQLPDVPAAARNVADLAKAFTDPLIGGFSSEHCVSAPPKAGMAEIGDLLAWAASEAEDLLLFYYSGHGLLSARSRELYLSLASTIPAQLAFTALPYAAVRDAFLESRAAARVVILDSCFSGSVIGEPLGYGDEEILEQVRVAGTYTLASAPANRTAVVLPGERHTAFTERLLRLICEGSQHAGDVISMGDIYFHLRRQMHAEGLPMPQQRNTDTADHLGLVRNRFQSGHLASPPSPGILTPTSPLGPPARPDPPPTKLKSAGSRRKPPSRERAGRQHGMARILAGVGVAIMATLALLVYMIVSGYWSRPSVNKPLLKIIFSDDFRSKSGNWTTDDPYVQGGYVKGTYQLSVVPRHIETAEPTSPSAVFPSAPSNIIMSVAARRIRGAVQNAEYGIFCRGDGVQAYFFTVYSAYALISKVSASGKFETLATAFGSAIHVSATNELRASCADIRGRQAVRLIFWVNGKQLAAVTDSKNPIPDGSIGVAVGAYTRPASATFTNFVVEVPSGEVVEVRSGDR